MMTLLLAFTASVTLAAPYGDPNGNTHVVCQNDATQSYELYIPSSAPTSSPSPILYGFDPGGNGKSTLLLLADAAAANGWILAVSNNAQNGPWADIFTAQDAVLQDTEARLNLHPTRRFAAGLSGGARMSLALAFRYPSKICGTLMLAAGWPVNTDLQPSTTRLITYMIMGTQDSNYPYDLPWTQGQLVAYGIRCMVKTFNGGHQWPPPDMILSACQWLNQNAEVDPNAGLPPETCLPESLVCQPPPMPDQTWRTNFSDTSSQQTLFENFSGVASPIMKIEWWAITGAYNLEAGYWLPSDPNPDEFKIRFFADAGGRPGGLVHEESVVATRTDLRPLYSRNYPLRRYTVTLSTPVFLDSGWVSIQQTPMSDSLVLWLSSLAGDGLSLVQDDVSSAITESNANLAVNLMTVPLSADFAAAPTWGKPPLSVEFSGLLEGYAPVAEWRWDFGDGTILEGDESNPVHAYSQEGAYTVTLTVTTAMEHSTIVRNDFVIVTNALPVENGLFLAVLTIILLSSGAHSFVARRRQA